MSYRWSCSSGSIVETLCVWVPRSDAKPAPEYRSRGTEDIAPPATRHHTRRWCETPATQIPGGSCVLRGPAKAGARRAGWSELGERLSLRRGRR
ncbi:hypothetical protein GN956_G2733 [Arapaima gigas]